MTLNVLKSWSLQYLVSHARHLTLLSAARCWRAVRAQVRQQARPGRTLWLHTRRRFPNDLVVREYGTDLETFDEVFVDDVYAPATRGLTSCRYVIDVGANIGLASMLFALLFPEAQVFALEPDPDNFGLLKQNLAVFLASGRCLAEQAAAWNETTTLCVTEARAGEFNSIQVMPAGDGGSAGTVQAYAMVDVLKRSGFPYVDLLKIDVEGAETALLRGDTTWLDNVGRIAIEFHGDSRRTSGFDAIMAERGFHITVNDGHTVVASRR